MIAILRPHPGSSPALDLELSAALSRAGGRLRLDYALLGDDAGNVRIPPVSPPRRTDELWRATCFEVFVRAHGGAYYEFNVAPSTEWAAYRFTGYRAGMADAEGLDAPAIRGAAGPGAYRLQADLDLSAVPDLPADEPWRLAVSAVLQEATGAVSYWALAHGPGKPDFHHPDSFVLDLPPPDPA